MVASSRVNSSVRFDITFYVSRFTIHASLFTLQPSHPPRYLPPRACKLRHPHRWTRRNGKRRGVPPVPARGARAGAGPIRAPAPIRIVPRPDTDHSRGVLRASGLRADGPAGIRVVGG